MTIDGKPINTNSREYIALMKELESDTELALSIHPLQAVQGWQAPVEGEIAETDALCASQEIGIPWGVPFERPERNDEPPAVSFLTIPQAG